MERQLSIIKDKQFIIIGANSGLANFSVKKFSRRNLVFGTYNKSRPKETKDFYLLKKLDLSKKKQIEAFINKISKDLSKIVLINFGVFNQDNLLVNVEEEELLNSFQINVFSNFYLNKMLIPIMIKNNWGRIIHLSSQRAFLGAKGASVYGASKSSLIGLSNNIASEYARFGITSNIINMGYFESTLFYKLDKSLQKEYLNSIPGKKLGTAEDIFNVLEMIVKNPFMNGSIIDLHGGAKI